MKNELIDLENTKFRIEKVIHNEFTIYYPQAKIKMWGDWHGFFSSRDSKKFKEYHSIMISDHNNTFFSSEKDAIEFIEYYKKWKKQEILDRPEKEKQFRKNQEEWKKFQEEQEIRDAEKNKPKIEHKYL